MPDCLFCKIKDGQIPAKVIYRDDHCLAFEDIRPQAPLHVLFVPLEHIESLNEITSDHEALVGHLAWAAAKYAKEKGVAQSGYRAVFNTERDAGQTVFHIHLHLLAGRPLGWPPG
jgi:histidine triad (HIT) family protein